MLVDNACGTKDLVIEDYLNDLVFAAYIVLDDLGRPDLHVQSGYWLLVDEKHVEHVLWKMLMDHIAEELLVHLCFGEIDLQCEVLHVFVHRESGCGRNGCGVFVVFCHDEE